MTMLLDPARWRPLDVLFERFLATSTEAEDRWLLLQTIVTGPSRRSLIGALGVQPGWRVLDAGCGYGAVPLELASIHGVDAHGIDIDEDKLDVAGEMRDSLSASGWLHDSSKVGYDRGDVLDLPFPEASFDLAFSRLVWEYLPDPSRAAAEMVRVVRPGGTACVVDVDDGLSISYPEPSEAFSTLRRGLTGLQAARGGDRYIGRKIAGLLDAAGFEVVGALVLPQAGYGPSLPGDLARKFLVDRFTAVSGAVAAAGLATEEELDEALVAFAAEETPPQCSVEGHVAIIGRRRLA
jgi:SAM-dependent methyltransferase